MRGIGPICRATVLDRISKQKSNICDYDVQIFEEEKIVLIHELSDHKNPKISLTNCVEFVIKEVVENYKLCIKEWDFVQHSSWKQSLFGGYDEYDLVSITESIYWKYIWHSNAKDEHECFSLPLLIDRVIAYRQGAKSVLGKKVETRLEVTHA